MIPVFDQNISFYYQGTLSPVGLFHMVNIDNLFSTAAVSVAGYNMLQNATQMFVPRPLFLLNGLGSVTYINSVMSEIEFAVRNVDISSSPGGIFLTKMSENV